MINTSILNAAIDACDSADDSIRKEITPTPKRSFSLRCVRLTYVPMGHDFLDKQGIRFQKVGANQIRHCATSKYYTIRSANIFVSQIVEGS